ncbi:MAG: hypothetical protein L0Y54_09440 [Sporichthyaceae bacterium]|nr:hypothetical protein [Sporichthyaceae bacterium]
MRALRRQFAAADFAMYGLDGSWRGPRWLGRLRTDPDGTPLIGELGHGNSREHQLQPAPSHVVGVLSVRDAPPRLELEGTSVGTAAFAAAECLVQLAAPLHLEADIRETWVDQQADLAFELASELDADRWSTIELPVDAEPAKFRCRDTGYGWIAAGESQDGFIGLYGRGVELDSLVLVTADLQTYS